MKHLISYLLFVGLPFAGLLAVIRSGQDIKAPMAVHGAYAIQPMPRSGMACQAYLLGGGDSTLTIVQSGRQLTLRLGPTGDVTLNGTLSGETFWARGVIEEGATPRYVACPVGDTLRVTARVRRGGSVKRLDATLTSLACVECAPLEFSAARPRQYAGRRRS
ncbi:MAG TPA: hypothetical protein VEB59_04950 [Gemmatimonadales bacterium]|nr:hypothetical protein [Gemmatimonadales bacterium]